MRDIVFVIVCILLYGCATFFKRVVLLNLHPYQFLLLANICYTMMIPIWYYLIPTQVGIPTYPVKSIISVGMYAVFSTAAGLILAFLLQKTNSPGALIVMTNLSSIITLFLCCMFLQEQLNLVKIIAVCLAIASLILINL